MEQNPTPNATPSEPQAPAAPEPAQAPVEPAGSVVEPAPKKKKGGLIAAIIIAILVIGGAVAAVLLLSGGGDVKSATGKFFDTLTAITTPEETKVENKNLKVDGDIKINAKSSGQEVKMGMKLALEANDKSDARIYFGFNELSVLGMSFDKTIDAEIRSFTGKSSYLKLGGLDEISSMLSLFLDSSTTSVLDDINDIWLKIDASDFDGKDISGMNSESVKCLTDSEKEIISELFSEQELSKVFSLEAYTGDEQKVDSGTLYTLKINQDAAKEYGKKLQDKFDSLSKKCNISTTNSTLPVDNSSLEKVETKVEDLPQVYIVVDKNEISRVFTEIKSDDATASINLNLSYPKTLDIEEPKDATPIKDVMGNLGGLLGGGGGTTKCGIDERYDSIKNKCVEDDDDYSCPSGYYYDFLDEECVLSSDVDPEIEAQVDKFYDSLLDEEPEIADLVSEDDLKPIIEDLVICLDDAGVELDSLDDLDESDESVAECYSVFQSDVEDLFVDYLDS